MADHPGSHLSQGKAKKILRDGSVRGQKLTSKQKGLFGVIAGGKRPNRLSQLAKNMRSK